MKASTLTPELPRQMDAYKLVSSTIGMNQLPSAFWSVSASEVLQRLGTSKEGLSSEEARQRLARYGSNLLKPQARSNTLALLLGQFKSPIILLLLLVTGLSFFLHDPVNALIILAIVLASGLLGFWQEHSATRAVEKLLAMVQIKATALRDGKPQDTPVEQIVPGDIVVLTAGDLVPGDCLVDESKDLFVDEATLTGETYPAEKSVGVLAAETALAQRTNALWMGTHVVSGSAKALVVTTGKETEFGKVSERLKLRPEETEFERGIRRFGYFLMQVTLVLVMAIFAINLYLERPFVESMLFSLALAVGLTPQLLPAIISINLAQGAKRMAQARVIVKRLASIENFGSMDILCTDKTGTLTQGTIVLNDASDAGNKPSNEVRQPKGSFACNPLWMWTAIRATRCFCGRISTRFTRPALPTRSTKPSAPIARSTCPTTASSTRFPMISCAND